MSSLADLTAGGCTLTGPRTDWTPHTSWTQWLFSSTGRIGRLTFLTLAALLLVLTVAFQRLVPHPAYDWAGWIVYPALLFCGACVLCKRLHDRGRRGWWAGLVLWCLSMAWPAPHGLLQAPYLLILALAAVDLGLMPGQSGFNRFGSPP